MGRKSAAKAQRPASGPPEPPGPRQKSIGPILLAVLIVGLVGIGVLAMWSRSDTVDTSAGATSSSTTPPTAATTPPDAAEVAKNEASAQTMAALGPHKQAKLPPIPFRGYAPPRPTQVVTAAFEFAAEHPEVLSYVPCFCGCQNSGHRGNEDCFVRSRDANGDVTEWEEHGLECAVCIDVATRSRQMYASGASVTDIRAAVEKEFAGSFPSMTPTPKPPAHRH